MAGILRADPAGGQSRARSKHGVGEQPARPTPAELKAARMLTGLTVEAFVSASGV